jgi:hypothetical protein
MLTHSPHLAYPIQPWACHVKKHYLLSSSGIKIESITEMAKDFSISKIAILVIIEVRTRDTTLPLLRVAGSTPLGQLDDW